MSIFRYPLSAPVAGENAPLEEGATEAIDYVCFQRSTVSYNDTKKGAFSGYSFTPPGSDSVKRDPNPNRVYLAMPKQLNTGFAPRYKQIDLGVVGASALSTMGADLGGDLKDVAQIIQQAAQAGLPEFASNAIADVANGLAQAGGLSGGLDGNAIQALTKGRVFNPFKEQVFSGLDFRTHNFNFKLLSRSEEEARRVKDIINYFKFGALPTAGQGETVDTSGLTEAGLSSTIAEGVSSLAGQRFFTVPDTFNIKFIRVKPDQVSADDNFMHFKIHPSVCTGIQINYTPDGQYTSFKSINGDMVQVPAIQLGLTFAELKLVTKGDIKQGF